MTILVRDLSEPVRITDTQADQPHFVLQSLTGLPLQIGYRNGPQVREYLERHSEIIQFLSIAWPQLSKYFGWQTELVLELLHFVDEQAEPELVGWIQCTSDVETGLHRFNAFLEDWFLDHMDQLNSRFNFNLEFK